MAYLKDKLSPQSPSTTDEGGDLYTLESLIKWLEAKPADGQYEYWNCDGSCLLSQFVREQSGISQGSYDQTVETFGSERRWLLVSASSPYGKPPGQTYGAALQRAKSALQRSRAALKGEGKQDLGKED